jgi:hypothetical protein
MLFIQNHGLMGKGLGYIDMHLIASAVLTKVPIWTLDKKLNGVCSNLRIVSREDDDSKSKGHLKGPGQFS